MTSSSRHLHIDPFAGIAGDMFLGACIDLGADSDALQAALRPLQTEHPWRLHIHRAARHGIEGVDLKVHVDQGDGHAPEHEHGPHTHDHKHEHSHDHAHDHAHAHTGYRAIMNMIDQMDAPDRAKQRARDIVTRLGQAEAAVHGIDLEKVHFHEVGAVDSIIDMLGAAVAVELLDIDTFSSGPLPLGGGFVDCAHGRMPLPAPATARILRGIPTLGVDRQCETVTPTGAAIVAALVGTQEDGGQYGPLPAMSVSRIGYGAGDRDDPDLPNLLRLYLGDRLT